MLEKYQTFNKTKPMKNTTIKVKNAAKKIIPHSDALRIINYKHEIKISIEIK